MERNQNNPNSWSELPQDLVITVLERLGFADFKQAKSVCSSWNSASRQSVPKKQVPWLILFPRVIKNTLRLFNPEEKDKLYKTQSLGVKFANSFCWTTYGSWLLMQDLDQWNLYIVNLFTHEIINLPPMESQLGMTKVQRIEKDRLVIFDHLNSTYRSIFIRSPVFWIDESTNEYIVLYGLNQWNVVYAKKGDNFWNQVPEISDCNCMVYKDHKLYFISNRNTFTILDFSGYIPQKTFQCSMLFQLRDPRQVLGKRFVVTITGDILMVENLVGSSCHHIIFKIYSSSSGFLKKYERVDSLGEETMLLDLGITVLANQIEGLRRNSIYFGGYFSLDAKDLFIFNLETRKMERLHKFDFDRSLYGGARWFVPSFTRT